MAEVPQANPCAECPFRKASLKGYVGGHEHVVEILDIIHVDGKFPCHMRVNAIVEREGKGDGTQYEAWQHAMELAPFCTGAIAYANNTCKLVRHPDAARYADAIGKRDDVFHDPIEIQAYHHGVCDVRMIPTALGLRRLSKKQVEEWLARRAKTAAEAVVTNRPKRGNTDGNNGREDESARHHQPAKAGVRQVSKRRSGRSRRV